MKHFLSVAIASALRLFACESDEGEELNFLNGDFIVEEVALI